MPGRQHAAVGDQQGARELQLPRRRPDPFDASGTEHHAGPCLEIERNHR
jgi:hypothetical protein